MTEYWKFFWALATPSLTLGLGVLIGAIIMSLAPISEDEKKKMVKEIEDGVSSFVSEFTRPFDKVGPMFIGRLLFNYITGLFVITIVAAMVSETFNLPQVREAALRIITEAAQYLPMIIMLPLIIALGQEAVRATGKLSNWLGEAIHIVKRLIKENQR